MKSSSRRTKQHGVSELDTGTYQISPEAFVIRTLINPLRLVRTLIQLGHEPLPPTTSTFPFSLFGLSHFTFSCYPNVFIYTRHLFHTYGFWSVMTCGFFSTFCFDALTDAYCFVSHRYVVSSALNAGEWLEDSDVVGAPKFRFAEGAMGRLSISQFATHLLNLCFFKTYEVLLTQPFYVILVRQAASVVGNNSGYSWFFQAVMSIFRDNGIMGFFSGITPRLIFELSHLLLFASLSRLLRPRIFGFFGSLSKTVRNSTYTLSYAVSSFLAYRLEVVSCVMALHGSRIPTLEAAMANSFSDWRECERTLAVAGQLQRGYFPFWRFCPSPALSA
ncbi:unnamed protein product [Hydatigera taeniaeformis]|uniref:Mitochondrial carrier 2 n=1 Tax=Hydatigena taeniaeformis TaxID=6205 RepID=A0A0R3WJK8_HYDTA|nr:unnamed protein product [Hydatigera taeniaeformis]